MQELAWTRTSQRWERASILISFAVLLTCPFFTFSYVWLTPYPGLSLSPSEGAWVVTAIADCGPQDAACGRQMKLLEVGARMRAIGNLQFAEFSTDRTSVPFLGSMSGQEIDIFPAQEESPSLIRWKMPTISLLDRVSRLSTSVGLVKERCNFGPTGISLASHQLPIYFQCHALPSPKGKRFVCQMT